MMATSPLLKRAVLYIEDVIEGGGIAEGAIAKGGIAEGGITEGAVACLLFRLGQLS